MRRPLVFACVCVLLVHAAAAAHRRTSDSLSAVESPSLHGNNQEGWQTAEIVPSQSIATVSVAGSIARAEPSVVISSPGVLPPSSPPKATELANAPVPAAANTTAAPAPQPVATLSPAENRQNVANIGTALKDVVETLNGAGQAIEDTAAGAKIGVAIARVKQMDWLRKLGRLGLMNKTYRDKQRTWIYNLLDAARKPPAEFKKAIRKALGKNWKKRAAWLAKLVKLWLKPVKKDNITTDIVDWVNPIIDSLDKAMETEYGKMNWRYVRLLSRRYGNKLSLFVFGNQVAANGDLWDEARHRAHLHRIAKLRRRQMQYLIQSHINSMLDQHEDPHAAELLKQTIKEANSIDSGDPTAKPILNEIAKMAADMTGVITDPSTAKYAFSNLHLHHAIASAAQRHKKLSKIQRVRAQAMLSQLRIKELKLKAAHLDQKEQLHLHKLQRRLGFLNRFLRLHQKRLAFQSKVRAMKLYFQRRRRAKLVDLLHAVKHSKITQQQKNTTKQFLEATAEALWQNFAQTLHNHQQLRAEGDMTQKAIDRMQAKQLEALKKVYLSKRQKIRDRIGTLYKGAMSNFSVTLSHLQQKYNDTISSLKAEVENHKRIQQQLKQVMAQKEEEQPNLNAASAEVDAQRQKELDHMEQIKQIVATREEFRALSRRIFRLRRRFHQIKKRKGAVWINVKTALRTKLRELRLKTLAVREKLVVLLKAEKSHREDLSEQRSLRRKVEALSRALLALTKNKKVTASALKDVDEVGPNPTPNTEIVQTVGSSNSSVKDGVSKKGDGKGKLSKTLGMNVDHWKLPKAELRAKLDALKAKAAAFHGLSTAPKNEREVRSALDRHRQLLKDLKFQLKRRLRRYLFNVNKFIKLYKRKLRLIRRREGKLRAKIAASLAMRPEVNERMSIAERTAAQSVLASEEQQKAAFRNELGNAVKRAKVYLAKLQEKLQERIARKKKFFERRQNQLKLRRARWIRKLRENYKAQAEGPYVIKKKPNPNSDKYAGYAAAYRSRQRILYSQRRTAKLELANVRQQLLSGTATPALTLQKQQLEKEVARINRELRAVARLAAHFEDLAGQNPDGQDNKTAALPLPANAPTAVPALPPAADPTAPTKL